MEFKIKNEIKKLIAAGISEEYATLIAASKYGNLDLVSDVVSSFAEENQIIKEEMEEIGFKPFVVENTDGILSVIYNENSNENNNENKVIELSIDIIEKTDDKNEITDI